MRRQAVSQAGVDMVALVVQINRGSPLSDSEDAVLAPPPEVLSLPCRPPSGRLRRIPPWNTRILG
jgi:hypothetical protein